MSTVTVYQARGAFRVVKGAHIVGEFSATANRRDYPDAATAYTAEAEARIKDAIRTIDPSVAAIPASQQHHIERKTALNTAFGPLIVKKDVAGHVPMNKMTEVKGAYRAGYADARQLLGLPASFPSDAYAAKYREGHAAGIVSNKEGAKSHYALVASEYAYPANKALRHVFKIGFNSAPSAPVPEEFASESSKQAFALGQLAAKSYDEASAK